MKRFVIGVGPGKAGTTFFFDWAFKSKRTYCAVVKETYYCFNESFSSREYEGYFPDGGGCGTYLEVSNRYIYLPEKMKVAAQNLDNSTFVFFWRAEFDRWCSALGFERKMGSKIAASEFAQEFAGSGVSNAELLERLGGFVGYDRIYIINFRELIRGDYDFRRKINNDLGIFLDETVQHTSHKNSSVEPRSPGLARIGRRVAWFIRAFGFLRVLQFFKSSKVVNSILFSSNKVVITEEEKGEARRVLRESHVLTTGWYREVTNQCGEELL